MVADAGSGTPPAAATPAVPKIKATLYFASEDGLHLVPTERDVPLAEGAVAQARAILEAQLAAEAPAPLVSTIPEGLAAARACSCRSGTRCSSISIRRSGPRIPAARMQELMTVYTIVNALLTNLPNLQEVQILIGGQEADTLAGHVDLRRPLRKNER